MHLSQIDEIS